MEFTLEFKSERLVASPIQVEDWPALLEAVSSDLFPVELPLARVKTEEQSRKWYESRVHDWEAGTAFVWSLRLSNSTEVIGQISLTELSKITLRIK